MNLTHRQRNQRALHALAGLTLVFAVMMTWMHGKVQKKLENRFTAYIIDDAYDTESSDEYLDRLIQAKQLR